MKNTATTATTETIRAIEETRLPIAIQLQTLRTQQTKINTELMEIEEGTDPTRESDLERQLPYLASLIGEAQARLAATDQLATNLGYHRPLAYTNAFGGSHPIRVEMAHRLEQGEALEGLFDKVLAESKANETEAAKIAGEL